MNSSVVIIGAGPAGLMAAETLSAAGCSVDVFDAMPTVGRKFLMAGRGGLNLTHSEPTPLLLTRFQHGLAQPIPQLFAAISGFDGSAVRAWADQLGANTFVGSSGRVFPQAMKAAPLLRAWLRRLQDQGVRFHVRHRWLGWGETGKQLCFNTSDGERVVTAERLILALGGASWPRLGSNGAWQTLLQHKGINIAPFRPANCGFEVNWSNFVKSNLAGQPLKAISLTVRDEVAGITVQKRGDVVISQYGLEGGALYALSATIRDLIERDGVCELLIDLLPSRPLSWVLDELSHSRGSRSWSSFLQSRLQLPTAKRVLLQEVLPDARTALPAQLASKIKALPLQLTAARPLAEAISSAGGVCFTSLDECFQLKALPGVFCAGEMLDWEAPTGGYLLTACLATGRAAALGVLQGLDNT